MVSAETTLDESDSREHHLFVGADIFIKQNDELITVERIQGKSAKIQSPASKYIPIEDTGGLLWRMNTKVSAVTAAIDDFRAVSISLQETRDWAERINTQNDLEGLRHTAANAKSLADFQTNLLGSFSGSVSPEDGAFAQEELDSASLEAHDQIDEQSSLDAVNDSAEFGELTGRANSGFAPDALEISFQVSSPTTLSDAYVFITITARLHENVVNTSFYRHVKNVGSEPRKVRFVQEGFTPGFEVQKTQIHLFSYGEEIATNLSEKRFPLTHEQAQEFLRLSNLGENRQKTVLARPAWSLAPNDLWENASSKTFDYSVKVNLDADGKLLSIDDTSAPLPNSVRQLIEQLTFIPALENGSPIASTLTFNPADFYKN